MIIDPESKTKSVEDTTEIEELAENKETGLSLIVFLKMT